MSKKKTATETVIVDQTPVFTLTKSVGGAYVVAEILVPTSVLGTPTWSRGPESLDLALSTLVDRALTTCGPIKKAK